MSGSRMSLLLPTGCNANVKVVTEAATMAMKPDTKHKRQVRDKVPGSL